MEKKLKKSILITGCSSGIGEALLKRFISEGFLVFGSIRDKDASKSLLEKYGDRFFPLFFDVTKRSEIEKAFSKVKSKLNGENLDILVNNAGIAILGPVEHIKQEEFSQHLDTMVVGAFNCVQVFLPLLGTTNNNQRPGKIINISSGGGTIGQPFMSSYCTSKHALEGFSESLRRELMMYKIDVIIVAPRSFKTPIWAKSNIDERVSLFGKTNYKKSFSNFSKYVTSLSESGEDVSVLAKKIYHISNKRRPKAKYSFGPSGVQFFLIRHLPKTFSDRLLAKFFQIVN